jgi:large subunit ribosomal protein L21
MFAIVDIAGQQFKVEKGKSYFVHRLHSAVDENVSFDKVLLLYNESDIQVGMPLLKSVSVDAKVLEHLKGDKVVVFKKKRRKGYKVKTGHRQCFTKILVEDIVLQAETVIEESVVADVVPEKVAVVEQPVETETTPKKRAPKKETAVEQPAETETTPKKKAPKKTTAAEQPAETETTPKKRAPKKATAVEQPAETETTPKKRAPKKAVVVEQPDTTETATENKVE